MFEKEDSIYVFLDVLEKIGIKSAHPDTLWADQINSFCDRFKIAKEFGS